MLESLDEEWLLSLDLFCISAVNVLGGKFKLSPKESIFVSQRSVHTIYDRPAGRCAPECKFNYLYAKQI